MRPTEVPMEIPILTSSALSEHMLSALDHAGCLVVTGLLDEEDRKSIGAE